MTKFGRGPLQQKIFGYLQQNPEADVEQIMHALKMTAAQVHPVVSDGVRRKILTASGQPRRYRYDGAALAALNENGAHPKKKRSAFKRSSSRHPEVTMPLPPVSWDREAIIAALQIRIDALNDVIAILRRTP